VKIVARDRNWLLRKYHLFVSFENIHNNMRLHIIGYRTAKLKDETN
jgi:hypothetical protein